MNTAVILNVGTCRRKARGLSKGRSQVMSEIGSRVPNDRAPLNIERRPGRDFTVQVGAPTYEQMEG